MIKFQIRLDDKSFQVLQGLARQEYRDPRIQAALIIRQELERRGLLPAMEVKTPEASQVHNANQ
jgi:hypothetical protein